MRACLRSGKRNGSWNWDSAQGDSRRRSMLILSQAVRKDSFHRAHLYGIDTAHLTGPCTYALPCPGIHDGVRFDVFAYLPAKLQRAPFFLAWLALRHDARAASVECSSIRGLREHAAADR